MQLDYETVFLALALVLAPAAFAFLSVKKHVSGFIRDVEREEQEAADSRKND